MLHKYATSGGRVFFHFGRGGGQRQPQIPGCRFAILGAFQIGANLSAICTSSSSGPGWAAAPAESAVASSAGSLPANSSTAASSGRKNSLNLAVGVFHRGGQITGDGFAHIVVKGPARPRGLSSTPGRPKKPVANHRQGLGHHRHCQLCSWVFSSVCCASGPSV